MLYVFIVTSADGFYAGPVDEFDWPVVDDEFMSFSVAQLGSVSTLLFGRVTYLGMASYWPTPAAREDDPVVAGLMNSLPKVVVSRSLEPTSCSWENSRVVRDLSEVASLKAAGEVAVFGSSALAVSLLSAGLVDEVRVMIHPVALGQGKSLFRSASARIGLDLVGTRLFRSGNVLLTYQPK